ncbi:MAG TPA: hypothetical protein ENN29_09565 [Candidatus Hydrogenedentes bacterium]|nr:hypothetical protein [Candidatus Hydrogenedentota bacterium]
MIQIGLNTAIIIYGSVIVIGAVLLYFISELRAARVYRVLEKQFLWRCPFCGFLYLDETAGDISQCPRCESFNSGREAQDRAVIAARQQRLPTPPEPTGIGDDAPRRNPSRRKRHGSRRGPRRRR